MTLENRNANSREIAGARSRLTIAWLAVLPASSAGLIVYRVLLHREPTLWVPLTGVVVLLLLVGLSNIIVAWRPLRRYFLALIAFAAGGMIADSLAATLDVGRIARMFANTFLALIPCVLLALTLIGSGATRRDVFLAKGNMAAPGRMPRGSVSWRYLGPTLTIIMAGGLALQLTLTLHPDLHLLVQVAHALPLAVTFAVVNAVQEEFRFRSVFLAHLVPTVGAGHAVFLTSLLFGLEHWFGNPSGPSGVLLAGFAGFIWARSMIETHGSAWAWLIHAFMDVVIFLFLVAAH